MKEKYFTPDISKIHVGYECETRQFTGGNWFKCIIDEEMYYADDNGLYKNNCPLFYIETYFRTPYLTKEQIETEEWSFIEDRIYKNFQEEYLCQYFKREVTYIDGVIRDLELVYTPSINRIEVRYDGGDFNPQYIFDGKIYCINEFRNILKYLCINT